MTNSVTVNELKKAPFKADQVGSFLRPERLKIARIQKDNGEITADDLRIIEDKEITKLVKNQKESGLKAVTESRDCW